MNHKKFKYFILTFFCAALLTATVLLPTATRAQQGRYANVYSKRDVNGIVTKLETSSNEFRRNFDRYMDQSTINGTREEDRLNGIVNDYETALDRLRREFDRTNTWWNSRADVQNVMRAARPVNGMMNNLSFARRLERQWNNMRRDLNKLADTYDLPALGNDGSGNGNGNGNGNGGGNANVPNWAIGDFYAQNPETGGTIALTINGDGTVVVNFDGAITNATVYGDTITVNGVQAKLSRIKNGIRARRVDNGQVIDYTSNGNNNGGGNGNGNGSGNGNVDVPNWATGTFYARNPETGGTITLTINRNGNVTIDFDGTVNYASYSTGDRITLNGITSRVSRIRNGVRTQRIDNGQIIDYLRR